MVSIQGQREEVFPEKQKQETLPWDMMGHQPHSHHLRWKQSCWHSGFGVILNVIMSSLLGGYANPQGHLSGAGLSFSPSSTLELTDRAPSKLCSFYTTRLCPAPTRSSAADTARVGAQRELKPKSEPCPSPKSLLPQGTSQRGAWDAPTPRKEIFLGTAQVTPARKFKSPLWHYWPSTRENDADFQNHSSIWSTDCFPWHSCSTQRGKGPQWCSLSSCQKKVFPPAERERSCSRQGTTSIIYILHHHQTY